MKYIRICLVFLFIAHMANISADTVPANSNYGRNRKGVILPRYNPILRNKTLLASEFDDIGKQLLSKQNCLKKSCKKHKSNSYKRNRRNKKIYKRTNRPNLNSTEVEYPDKAERQGGGAPAAPAAPALPGPFALLTIPIIGPILYTTLGFVIANLVLASTTRGEQIEQLAVAEEILQNINNFNPPAGRKGTNHTQTYHINKKKYKTYSTKSEKKIRIRQGIHENKHKHEHDSYMIHNVETHDFNKLLPFMYKHRPPQPPKWLMYRNLELISFFKELVNRLS